MSKLWQLGAVELAQGFRQGLWSPVAALESVLERVAEVNSQINALIALAPDAHAAALASQTRYAAGCPLSELDGIPMTIKDNLLMAGVPATWGCPALADNFAADELPVARLRAMGAVLVGKTNVPEFTLEGYTGNALFGTTRNPWDIQLTPGGSSGGAVAAVAAGIAPLALCTDGGGSIRRPCAHTGLVGLKPSIGAIARGAGFPGLLLDFEVVGPVGRSVADVQLMFSLLSGADTRDRRSLARAQARRQLQRVLYVQSLDGAQVDPQVRCATAEAAGLLEQLGCTVVTAELPIDLSALNRGWPEIGQIGLAHLFASYPQWRTGASAKYQQLADAGERLPASRLWAIIEQVEALRVEVDRMFAEYDALLMPTVAALPWPAEQAYPETIDGQSVGPRGHAIFTGWVNAAGVPAISLPVAESREGLPIGIQLVAPMGADSDLLTLAARIEQARPWHSRFNKLWQVSS